MKTTKEYLSYLLTDKTTTFEVLLELQNEGIALNYWESYEGTFEQIVQKCQTIVLGLKTTLPKGNFEVKVEDLLAEGAYLYVNEIEFYANNDIKILA